MSCEFDYNLNVIIRTGGHQSIWHLHFEQGRSAQIQVKVGYQIQHRSYSHWIHARFTARWQLDPVCIHRNYSSQQLELIECIDDNWETPQLEGCFWIYLNILHHSGTVVRSIPWIAEHWRVAASLDYCPVHVQGTAQHDSQMWFQSSVLVLEAIRRAQPNRAISQRYSKYRLKY